MHGVVLVIGRRNRATTLQFFGPCEARQYCKFDLFNTRVIKKMANACFVTHNAPGEHCKETPRGSFNIPTGGAFVDIGPGRHRFKVTYFKYAARRSYTVLYDNRDSVDIRPTWECNCPDYEFNNRQQDRTCCKHIQACIDKAGHITRTGGDYERFLVEHIT